MSKDYLNGDSAPNAKGEEQTGGQKSLIYFWIAIGCFAAGAVLFGLAFAIKGAHTQLLIASMIVQLACATFLNAQKRKYNFLWVKVVRVACYAVMIAAIAIILFGTALASK